MQEINFFESGKGYPLVFLHGFCETNKIWKDLSLELSDQFRIICPDLPGFGDSALPAKQFSLEQIGDNIAKWLQSLGIDSCIVIGHSLGGYISLELLRKYSDLVQTIGLFNSTAFADAPDKKENRNKLIEFISEYGVAPFLKTFVPSLFYPPTAHQHQGIIDEIEKEGQSIKPESVMWYAAAMRDRVDSLDLLEAFSDRILLIAGEDDQNVPLEKSLEMSLYLANENVHIIPESAHMSVFEQPKLGYNAIRQFVAKFAH